MCGVNGRRFIVIFKQNSIRWFIKMTVWSLTCQQSEITVANISQFTHKMAAKASWHRNNVTVTCLCFILVLLLMLLNAVILPWFFQYFSKKLLWFCRFITAIFTDLTILAPAFWSSGQVVFGGHMVIIIILNDVCKPVNTSAKCTELGNCTS